MSRISSNLQAVRQTIADAAKNVSRRPDEIRLLAVSKTFGPQAVIEAAKAGQTVFGENYLQEALEKMAAVQAMAPGLQLEWHYIGPIQSNKTRAIAEHFDWVHSVDREKIARRLSEQRPGHLPPLNVCLQVNVSGEASKSGVQPDEVLPLVQAVKGMPKLVLRGFMTIPEPVEDVAQQRIPFAKMRRLYEQLRAQLQEEGILIDTLSMGMSADMEAAIAEGATIVRIGTAIFGQRTYAN
jgi:pyridoxal phosphate enzyme (YggS family)